jgi:hypothetical protein
MLQLGVRRDRERAGVQGKGHEIIPALSNLYSIDICREDESPVSVVRVIAAT